MTTSWVDKKGYDPDHLLRKIEKTKEVDDSGKVSFHGFEFKEYLVVLNSMIDFSNEIHHLERRKILFKALSNIAAKGEITSSKLLNEVSSLETQYFKAPIKKYILVTSISINRFCKLKRVKINECTISFHLSLPKIFIKEIDKIKSYSSNSIFGEFPRDYIFIKVRVSAKSYEEATNQALDALNLIRGIWNFYFNFRKHSRSSSGLRKPVNDLILGPLHTLHLPDGKMATGLWWYELEYISPVTAYNSPIKIKKMYKFENDVRKLLKKSNYYPVIKEAILRYTQALDLRDWESAFLKLWGVLELLTNTGNDSYKVTVRRASFLFKDREYARQVLSHLRDYRNRAVHANSENHFIEDFMYQIKFYVEALLNFHIVQSSGLNKFKEVVVLLDLPNDKAMLNTRIEIVKHAKKFLGYN